jgi:hypothetical protein
MRRDKTTHVRQIREKRKKLNGVGGALSRIFVKNSALSKMKTAKSHHGQGTKTRLLTFW